MSRCLLLAVLCAACLTACDPPSEVARKYEQEDYVLKGHKAQLDKAKALSKDMEKDALQRYEESH